VREARQLPPLGERLDGELGRVDPIHPGLSRGRVGLQQRIAAAGNKHELMAFRSDRQLVRTIAPPIEEELRVAAMSTLQDGQQLLIERDHTLDCRRVKVESEDGFVSGDHR
jgi:hypothetical protein